MNEAAATAFFLRNYKKIISISKDVYSSADGNIKSILGLVYENYLNEIKLKYSKSKSFFTPNQATDLYEYYVGTNLQLKDASIELANCDKILKKSRHIVISGTGGCGKSVFLKHLIIDSIENSEYTPIMIELRELNESKNSLDQIIEETLKKYGFNLNEKFIEKSKQDGGFILILDGFDEVNHNKRNQLIKDIKKFIAKNPLCPIIISTRPDDVFKGIDEFTIYQVKPLTVELATELIRKIPYNQEIKAKFTKALKESLFNTHESFLSNPLLLSIMLLTYTENANIPHKLSLFYSQAFEALFHKHDANKDVYVRQMKTELDIQDFSTLFSLFSLQTYDKRIFRMPRISCLEFISKSSAISNIKTAAESYLSDLLSATCLLIEDGLEIAYSHRSFQEYFVALYISKSPTAIQEKLIKKYSENFSTDQVMILLYELNPIAIEKHLFIPKLKSTIEKIELNGKPTQKNVYKFIERYISEIRIAKTARRNNVLLFGNEHRNEIDIIHFTVSQYHKIEFFNENTGKEMYEKFGDGNQSIAFSIKELNSRSPIIKYIAEEGGVWLGKNGITKIEGTLNKLIQKHKNLEQNIYEILGI